MARFPIVTPYAQTIPAVMNYLLSRTAPNFRIDMAQVEYVDSVFEHRDPDRAEALFRHTAAPEGSVFRIPYRRLDIDRYADLSPPHKRYLALASTDLDLPVVLALVLERYQVLLDPTHVQLAVNADPDDPTRQSVIVQPVPTHPVWIGQLQLWNVAANDIRLHVTRYHHPDIDPTH